MLDKLRNLGTVQRTLLNLVVTIVVGLVYFYVTLPAINLQDPEFYTYFIVLALFFCVLSIFTQGISNVNVQDGKEILKVIKDYCFIPAILAATLIAIFAIGHLISAPIFRAGAYQKLLTVEQGDFTQDIHEVSFDKIPMLDQDSATRLGTRKLGELPDMVSQFEVAPDYTQINYKGHPVRVTPLLYGDVIKWFNNRREGLPAYLIVDMVTQNVDVVRISEIAPGETGIKYTTAEHFGSFLYRHLRFNYPTFIFDAATFEINEEGVPYWVCPRIVKRIGLFGGTDIQGAVLVNAITGECTYYDDNEVPSWVDRCYTAELIIEQYDYYGMYVNGFINSLLGQRGVTETTDGYNYIVNEDDVYMYTGITSVGTDNSNLGFILTNQRTKETHYYPIAGAEEYSAAASAEGIVQHLSYKATFPLLLNISSQPTYFMALKDSAGLVKQYAMVNVQQYQIVANGDTVAECEANYRRILAQNNLGEAPAELEKTAVEGTIDDIRSAVIEGNTQIYVKFKNDSFYYVFFAGTAPEAVLLNVGDKIAVAWHEEAGALRFVSGFERK